MPAAVPARKSRFKLAFLGLLLFFVAIAFSNALGFWDDGLPYTPVNHGNHKHYMAKNRDEGIGLDHCPTRPPDQNEVLTSQCQLIRALTQGGTTYYLPDDAPENANPAAYPTRLPGPRERITPEGQLVKV